MPNFSKAVFAVCLTTCLLQGWAMAGAGEIHYDEGVAFYRNGEYKHALEAFEDATRQMPQSQEAAYYKALCYAQLGRNEEARKAYQAVIALDANTEAASLAKEGLSYLPDPRSLDRPPQPQSASQNQNAPQQQANPYSGMDAKTMQMMMMMNSMGGGGGGGMGSLMMLPMMQQMMQGQNGTSSQNNNDQNGFSPEVMKTMMMQEMMQNVDLFGGKNNKDE